MICKIVNEILNSIKFLKSLKADLENGDQNTKTNIFKEDK